MAIKFDNIEAESLLNRQGELTITLTDDQGITVAGAITTPNLYLGGSSVRLSPGTNGEVGINYNTSATGSLVWYAGGTASKFNVTNAGNATFAGNVELGDSSNISMSNTAPGQLQIQGSGYTGAIALNATAMYIYHNSGLRDLVLGTDETARLTIDGGNGNATFAGTISATNFSGSSSGTNTGDQDLSSYLTSVAFSDLTSKPSTLSGYGILDGVSLGTENVFTGDNEFQGDLLRTNQRINTSQEYPLGHYTPGETVFELNPTWSNRELRQYFGNDSVSWDEVANAPGGYAVYINGSVSVGGAYNSGFPYIPIDQDGIYYMECWIKNAGTGQGHYMGSIDYQANFTNPSSGGGNPGSYGYFVMSNYTGASDWTKVSGYITGHHNSNTGAFETDATYWTPQALFNYSAGTGTRACWISGWKVIRVDHVGDRTFQDDVKVKGKLEVHTLDTNTASTTALVMNGNEVEKRTLGSNAFNSTSFLTSVDFTDIGGTVSSTGGATRTNYNLGFRPAASSYAGFRFYGADGNNAGYFLVRGTSDNGVYAANGITLVGDQGWLTLAHRYSSDKGIRFMTGDTSAPTRMTIASDGDININNSLTVGVDLAVTGNIKDNDYKHAGSDLWLTKKYVRSVGITGADIGNSWVQLSRVAIASSYGKLAAKFTIHGYDDVSSGTEVIDVIYENGNSAQENHGCQWYSTDNNANLFKAVRSIRSSSSGTDNTYDLYVQMNGDWRDTFTVVAEYWRTGTNQSISFITSAGSANEPSAGSDDIGHVERKWYTQNTYMYLGGSNRVYTTGDFTNNSSNWDTAYNWGNHASAGYLTAHPSITEASDVDNSGGTVIQDLTFDDNGHVTATGSVNLDNIYTSTDGTEDDYRFGLNLGNFTGTRWYKVATVNNGSGGLRIRGMMTNHVESFGSNMIDLAIQGREGGGNNDIEITGHVYVLHENAGIAIYSGEKPGSYLNWDVYVVATKYTQCQLDLTKVSGSFDTSGNYVTTEPTGTLELETYQLSEGNYVIRDSAAKRIFDQGINLAGGLSYTASTNTLSQTDNNTTYSVATTSANGLLSSTDKTKLDGIETGADVTDGTNVATAGALMATGGILSGTVKVTGSIIYENDADSGYIPFPKGAQYQTKTGSHTGAIKITLPTHGGDDMLKWVVDIYDYTTGESVTMFMGGYVYQATGGNEWVSCTVTTLTEHSSKDYTVRFGADGTNSCVWIGETNSTWSYPQVVVRDFVAGFISDIDSYDDNWSISFVTSFDTVDETISDNLPTADWDRIEGKPSTFAPTIGTTATTALAGNTSLFDGAYSSLSGTPTLGTAAAAAATDFISATSADTASELITFTKGTTTDGNSKFYNWRALDNTSNTNNSFWRIARITSAQSSRFMITLAGRSTSYSDGSLPAMGHIVGQLNNDNNYDVVFYNHSTASSEVVQEIGIVNVSNTVVDVYVKSGQYAELTATGHISDGSFIVYSNVGADGNTSVDGYVTVTEYTVMNTGNSDVLYKSGGTMSGDILLGTNSIAADTTSPTAHIQVGAGTTNTGSRSDVALLGAGNSGGVVHALGLVNTAAGANSNGVALNFHNGNAWSPTGQIIVKQNSSGTSTDSGMYFYTYDGGLNNRMTIKNDGNIRLHAYSAGLLQTDANGNVSVDTSTYLTGIASKSVGIAELNVTDGSAGQVLTTDGNGTLSFTTVSSGGTYTLPAATSTALGGVKIGYTANAKNYPVQLDASNKAYVNVPWTDANTTYSAGSGLDLNSGAFSVEADLRDGITHVGVSTNNYITFDNTNNRIDFYAGGTHVARMEAEGDLHIKGDVIAFSNIFA